MNVIERYAKLFSALKTDISMFDPDGPQSCPGDGVRTLSEFADGLDSFNAKYVKKVVLKSVFFGTTELNGQAFEEGLMVAETHFKVKKGEAKLPIYQIVKYKGDKILAIHSFWDKEIFKSLREKHAELKDVFDI